MSKSQSFDDKLEVRKSLIARIREKVNRDEMASAQELTNRNERIDAIANVLRDAVKRSSVIQFSGVPHVYIESVGCYQPFQWIDLNDALYDVMRKCGVRNGDYGKIDLVTRRCMAVITNRNCSIDMSVFVMANGVYNTIDHKIHPFSDMYMTNMKVGYAYNSNDVPVLWKNFLNDVLPDMEMQRLLQEFLASTFIDRSVAKIEQCLILLGSGSNGKSVIFEVVKALLGDDNMTSFSISDLINTSKRDLCIAMCNGKRLNYCSEIRTHEISGANSDAFKSLISGESTMARSLYHDYFMAKNIPLIMANANVLPKLSDPSLSIQRRFLVIPFKSYISEEKQNRELATELKTELSGIFNWVMEGLIRLKTQQWKITVPEETRIIVADYIKDNNPVIRFCDTRRYYPYVVDGIPMKQEFIVIRDIYADFIDWCTFERETIIRKSEFVQMLSDLKFNKTRRSIGSGFVIYRAKSDDEIRSENLDAAIEIQKMNGLVPDLQNMKKEITLGALEVERLLALPPGAIITCVENGKLEGAYERVDGELRFNMAKTVECLSMSGFFKRLKDNNKSVITEIGSFKKHLRHSFNTHMRTLGLPIRKYEAGKNVPQRDMYCILVPDDWKYSAHEADKLFRMTENQSILAMWNDAHPKCKVRTINNT